MTIIDIRPHRWGDDRRISGVQLCVGKLAETGRSRSFAPLPLIEWRPNGTVISLATGQALFLADVYRVNRVDLPARNSGWRLETRCRRAAGTWPMSGIIHELACES